MRGLSLLKRANNFLDAALKLLERGKVLLEKSIAASQKEKENNLTLISDIAEQNAGIDSVIQQAQELKSKIDSVNI